MLIAVILHIAIALAALGAGAWLALAGVMLAVHGLLTNASVRPLVAGIAIFYLGLVVFVAGAIGTIELMW